MNARGEAAPRATGDNAAHFSRNPEAQMSMKKLMRTAACAAALSLLASGAQAQGELFLYNWSNYFPPDLLTKFEKDTGIKVTLDVYDSNETRSEEHTSELQSLMRISYAVFCLKKKNTFKTENTQLRP